MAKINTKYSDKLAGPQLVKRYILEHYTIGQKLPGADELSELLGTTKYAATRALAELHAEGHIDRKPKKGSTLISQGDRKISS